MLAGVPGRCEAAPLIFKRPFLFDRSIQFLLETHIRLPQLHGEGGCFDTNQTSVSIITGTYTVFSNAGGFGECREV